MPWYIAATWYVVGAWWVLATLCVVATWCVVATSCQFQVFCKWLSLFLICSVSNSCLHYCPATRRPLSASIGDLERSNGWFCTHFVQHVQNWKKKKIDTIRYPGTGTSRKLPHLPSGTGTSRKSGSIRFFTHPGRALRGNPHWIHHPPAPQDRHCGCMIGDWDRIEGARSAPDVPRGGAAGPD